MFYFIGSLLAIDGVNTSDLKSPARAYTQTHRHTDTHTYIIIIIIIILFTFVDEISLTISSVNSMDIVLWSKC